MLSQLHKQPAPCHCHQWWSLCLLLLGLAINSLNTSLIVAAGTTNSTKQTFEAMLPSITSLVSFVIIIILSVIAAQTWANEVVPAKHTELDILKSCGEVKEYLDEFQVMALSNDDKNSPKLEGWILADWLQQ